MAKDLFLTFQGAGSSLLSDQGIETAIGDWETWSTAQPNQEIDRHAGSAPSRPTDGELATQVLTQMVQRPLPAGPDAVHIGFGTVEDDSGGRLRDEGVFELEHGGTVRGGGQAQLDLASRSVLIDPRDREQAGRCAAQDLATRVAREAERAADTENARYITSYVVPA